MKKILVYDLDGTIIDTGEDICRAVNAMMADLGKDALSRPVVDSYVGKGLRQLIENCLPEGSDKDIDRAAKIYRNYYKQFMLDNSAPYQSAVDFLKAYGDRVQVVLTNKPDPFAKDMLEALGVSQFFKEMIPGNSVYPKKPDPTGLLSVIERYGATKEECVMIGDSPTDIETARNAGIEVVVFDHGFTPRDVLEDVGVDHIMSHFEELFELAKKHQW